jgi:anaerobic selenocysteine-containing dehydrogenase
MGGVVGELQYRSATTFTHHQDRNRQVQAWRKLETFIVHDVQWTPTARVADIIRGH